MNSLVQNLHAEMLAHGLPVSLLHDNSIRLVENYEGGYTQYDVIPWAADPEVPVLYMLSFEERKEDGFDVTRPTTLHAYRTRLDPYFAQWITPTEHPLTGMPTWFVHPCHTREWLKEIGGSWWLWFQYVGAGTGITL